jgi:hypothetical protein
LRLLAKHPSPEFLGDQEREPVDKSGQKASDEGSKTEDNLAMGKDTIANTYEDERDDLKASAAAVEIEA